MSERGTNWSGEGNPPNMAYGVWPFQSSNPPDFFIRLLQRPSLSVNMMVVILDKPGYPSNLVGLLDIWEQILGGITGT